jgi:hypothetical protein
MGRSSELPPFARFRIQGYATVDYLTHENVLASTLRNSNKRRVVYEKGFTKCHEPDNRIVGFLTALQ